MKDKVFPVRSETAQSCPSSPLLHNTLLVVLATAKARKRKQKQTDWKGRHFFFKSLFTDDIMVYVENSKESTKRKLLGLISEFSNVSGYKIRTQKSIAFLYTNNSQVETKIKNAMQFAISPKKMKHVGINLTKYAKDMSDENSQMLMTEIKEDLNTWRGVFMEWKTRHSKDTNSP